MDAAVTVNFAGIGKFNDKLIKEHPDHSFIFQFCHYDGVQCP